MNLQTQEATNQSNTHKQGQHTSEKDMYGFVLGKIEKLATALYMVTTYMGDEEPVKKSLRTVALSSVSNASHLAHKKNSQEKEAVAKDLRHIISLVNLSETTNIMSHMNATILRDEYTKLLDLLEGVLDMHHGQNIALSHVGHRDDAYFFSDGNRELSQRQTHVLAPRQTYQDKTITEVGVEKKNFLHVPSEHASVRETATNIPHQFDTSKKVGEGEIKIVSEKNFEIQKSNEPKIVQQKDRKLGRRDMILATLSKEEPLTIKDIAKKVRGCSEKTIQRELNALLLERIARREGEKRWSKYMLA